jgi:hypothetical protein
MPGGFFFCQRTIVFGVGVAHVGEANAEAVVVGADQWIRSLQIDVVADQDESALLVGEINSSGGVSKNDGANSHSSEDAHGEGNLLRRVAFINVHAALHDGNRYGASMANDHGAGVADRGRARKSRDLGVRNAGRASE